MICIDNNYDVFLTDAIYLSINVEELCTPYCSVEISLVWHD